MQTKPLPIGIDDFGKLMKNGYYFIDKTLLIKQILDQKPQVCLFLRPRRFGKTLNLSMLQYFFDSTGENNGELFAGLDIMNSGEPYASQLGSRPVATISFKDARVSTWELSFTLIKKSIAREFKRHADTVFNHGGMSDQESFRYRRIMDLAAPEADYYDSLRFLTDILHTIHGSPAVLLIDEYDVPIEASCMGNYYPQMTDLMRPLLGSALKSNPSLDFAVMSGCLRISKESIFTGLNNLYTDTVVDTGYAEFFGFTASEAAELLESYGMSGAYERVKAWYDGYRFGNTDIYNPWSMLNHVQRLSFDTTALPANHWANTSGNDLVRSLLEHASEHVRTDLETLISGGTIFKKLSEHATYSDMGRMDDSVYTLLLMTGYLTTTPSDRSSSDTIPLRIPNREVQDLFTDHILSWMETDVYEPDVNKLYHAFQLGNASEVEAILQNKLQRSISLFDSMESFYHGFMTGLFQYLPSGTNVVSTRESGDGRPDLVITFPREGIVAIAEFKLSSSPLRSSMLAKTQQALDQIRLRKYDRDYLESGYETAMLYGIAFHGKYCAVSVDKKATGTQSPR